MAVQDLTKLQSGEQVDLGAAGKFVKNPDGSYVPVAPAPGYEQAVQNPANQAPALIPQPPTSPASPTSQPSTPVQPAPAPSGQDLNTEMQSLVLGGYGTAKKTPGDIISGIVDSLGQRPATPKAVETYKTLAAAPGGFNEAQQSVATAQKDLQDFESTLLKEQGRIKGQAIATTIINGQLVKLSADTAEAYRQKQNAVSQAQTSANIAQSTLSTMMNLTQQDYTNAVSEYNDKFSKAFQIYNALTGEQDKLKAEAAANMKVLTDLISQYPNAPLNYEINSQLDQLQTIQGIPAGTIQSFMASEPKAEVLTTQKNSDGTSTIYYKDPKTGKVGMVETIGTATSKSEISVLTIAQKIALTASGISKSVAEDITNSILGGAGLDDIRAALREDGLDPGILDVFDRIVNIKGLLQKTRFKSTEDEGTPDWLNE